jgi:hypothetical protein
MLLARSAGPLGLLVVLGGCGDKGYGGFLFGGGPDASYDSTGDGGEGDDGGVMCFGCGTTVTPAKFELSCGSTDLTSVVVAGPCATGDASPSGYLSGSDGQYVLLSSWSPGVCSVALMFATGFTYSAEVTFVSQTEGNDPNRCSCQTTISPTQTTFTVNNPSTTCVDAGLDAGSDG